MVSNDFSPRKHSQPLRRKIPQLSLHRMDGPGRRPLQVRLPLGLGSLSFGAVSALAEQPRAEQKSQQMGVSAWN